mmetsp:Transcript_73551/g.137439  ORF Transcript_73551/g.137439 Transcript_73551/m.137439 type:complete len:144 (+) Transcript_73551:133-564(+)
MENSKHYIAHRDPLAILVEPIAGMQSAVALLETTNNPRALFRLRIILSHLGMLSSEFQVQAESDPLVLPLAASSTTEERALLPWPLTDSLGRHLDQLLHDVSRKVMSHQLAQRCPYARYLPPPPHAPKRTEQHQEVERWWPAL